MLDLSTAVLCDFAQVRDRLLFVSSGAVSRLYRAELPSPIGLMVGLIIEVPLEDAGMNHSLRAEVINRHGTVLATLDNIFRVGDEGLFPHEVQQVPLVLSITGVRARTWGTHQIRLYLDDELVRALTLYVVPAAGTQAVRPAQSEEQRQPAPEPEPEPAATAPAPPSVAPEAEADPAPAAPAPEPEPAREAPAPAPEPSPVGGDEPVGIRTDDPLPEVSAPIAPPATIAADRADEPGPSWAPPSLADDPADPAESAEPEAADDTVAKPFSFDTLRDELADDRDDTPDEAKSRFAFRYRDDEG
jgi:hypothetical protein